MRHRWKRERQDEEVEGEVGRERQMAQGVEASWVGDSPKGGSAYTTNSIRGLPPRAQQVTHHPQRSPRFFYQAVGTSKQASMRDLGQPVWGIPNWRGFGQPG